VATLALAVLALAAAILAGLALRKQSREVAILVGQSEREARERLIAQASQVFILTETTDSPVVEGMQRPITPYRAIVAHLQNTSQQPVYDVTITWRKQGEPGEGSLVPIGPVLMPGQQEDRGTIFDPRGNPRVPSYPGVAANFRDAAGVPRINNPPPSRHVNRLVQTPRVRNGQPGTKRAAPVMAGSVARLPFPPAAHGDHVGRGDVPQVDIRGRERDVTQLLLDHVDRDALCDELGGVRVPQRVRVNPLGDVGPGRVALDHLAHLVGAQRPARKGAEQLVAAVHAEPGALGEPELDNRDRAVIDGHGAVMVAFAVQDADGAAGRVDVGGLEIQGFLDAEAGPVQDRDQRAVPDAGRGPARARGEQRAHLG
jgi:hypothetical protein